MSKETVLSMLTNIIHIIPTCPKSVASWIWLQNLRMLSLQNLLVVFLSYFDEANSETQRKKKYNFFAPYIFITTLICVWAFIFVLCIKCGSNLLVVLMYLFIRNVLCECNFAFQPPGAKSSIKPWKLEPCVLALAIANVDLDLTQMRCRQISCTRVIFDRNVYVCMLHCFGLKGNDKILKPQWMGYFILYKVWTRKASNANKLSMIVSNWILTSGPVTHGHLSTNDSEMVNIANSL